MLPLVKVQTCAWDGYTPTTKQWWPLRGGKGGVREGPLTLSVTFVSLTKRPEANMAKCQHLMHLAGRYTVYVFYYLNFSDV